MPLKILKKFIALLILLNIILDFLPIQFIFATINIVDQPKNIQIPSICEWEIKEGEKPKEFENNILKYAKAEYFLRDACNFFKMAEETAPSLIQDYNQIIENTDPLTKCNPLGNCFANCTLKGPRINVKIDITQLICDAVATLVGVPGGCSALFVASEYSYLINLIYQILNLSTFIESHTQDIRDIIDAFINLATSTPEFFNLAYILKEQIVNVIDSKIINEILTGTPSDKNATSTILQQFFNNMKNLAEEKNTIQERTNLIKGRIYEMQYLIKLNLVSFAKIQNQNYQSFIVLFKEVNTSSLEITQTIETHSNWKERFLPTSSPAYFTILNEKISSLFNNFPIANTSSDYVLIDRFALKEMEKFNFQENLYTLEQIINNINEFLSNPQNISEDLNNFKNALSDFKEKLSQLKDSFLHINDIAINVPKNEIAPSSYFTLLRDSFEKVLEPENIEKIPFLNNSLSSLLNLLQNPNNGLSQEQVVTTTLFLSQIQDVSSNLEVDFASLYSYFTESLEKDVIDILSEKKDDFFKIRNDIVTINQMFFDFLTNFHDILQSISTTTTTTLESDPQNPITFKEAVDREIENIKSVLDLNQEETLAFKINNLGNKIDEVSQNIQNNFGLDLKEYNNLLKVSLSYIENMIYKTLGESETESSGSLMEIHFEKTDNEEKEIVSAKYEEIPWTKIKTIQIPPNATSISPLKITFRIWSSDDAFVTWEARTNAKAKIRRNGEDITGEITSCNNKKISGYKILTYTTTTSGWKGGDNIELWVEKDNSAAAKEYIYNDIFEVKGSISLLPIKYSLLTLISSIKSNSWKDVYNCYRYKYFKQNCSSSEENNPDCYNNWGDLYELVAGPEGLYQKIAAGNTNPTTTKNSLLEETDKIRQLIGYCDGTTPTPDSICQNYMSLEKKIDNAIFDDFKKGRISKLIFSLATTADDIINFQDKINDLMGKLETLFNNVLNSNLTTKNEATTSIESIKTKILNNIIDIGNFKENINFLKNLPSIEKNLNNLGKLYQTIEKLEDTIKGENSIEKIIEEIDNFNIGVTSTIDSIRNDLNKISSKITKFQTNFQIGILTEIKFPPSQQGWMARWNYFAWKDDNNNNNNVCSWPYPVERDTITCCLPENFETNLGQSRWTQNLYCSQNEVITGIRWPNGVNGCPTLCGIFGPYRDWTGCWDEGGGKLRCTKILNSFTTEENTFTLSKCDIDQYMTGIQWPPCKQICLFGPSASRSWKGTGSCSCDNNILCPTCCSLFRDCTVQEGCNWCSGSFTQNYITCKKIYSQENQIIKYSDKICYDLKTTCENLLNRANKFKCFEGGDSTTSFGSTTITITSSTKSVFCPAILKEIIRLGCTSQNLPEQKCETATSSNCFETYDTTCGDIEFYNQLLDYGIETQYLKDTQYLPTKIKGDLRKIENISMPILNAMSLIGIFETTALLYQNGRAIFGDIQILTQKIPDLLNDFTKEVINNQNFNPTNLLNIKPIQVEIEEGKIFRCESLPPISKYQKESQNYNPVCAPTKDLAKKSTENYFKLRSLARRVIWIRDKNRITNTVAGIENPDTNKIELLAEKVDTELRQKAAIIWAFNLALGDTISPNCTCGNKSTLCDITYCLPKVIDLLYPLLSNISEQLNNPPWLENVASNSFDCDETLWQQSFVQDIIKSVIKNIFKMENPEEKVKEITKNLIGPKKGICELVAGFDHFINPYCITTWILHYLGEAIQPQRGLEDFIYEKARDIK